MGIVKEHKGAKLTDDWGNAFGGSFETEEDVFEFIYERLNTSDFEDSYIDVGGHGECNEYVKVSVSDKREMLHDFMMAILAEVQQYREIGTPEELQDMKNNYFEALSDWRQYRKIGTLEECRAAMTVKKEVQEIVNQQLIAGKNNYKETYDCFWKITKVVQANY